MIRHVIDWWLPSGKLAWKWRIVDGLAIGNGAILLPGDRSGNDY